MEIVTALGNAGNRTKTMMAFLTCFLLAAGAASAAEPTRSLISVPAPEVLGHGSVALSVDGRYFLEQPDLPSEVLASWGPMARLGVGLFGRGEAGIEMVSAFDSLDVATAYVRILLLQEQERGLRPAIGVGIFDLGYDKTPNADAALPATDRWEYSVDDNTNNSAYLVLAKRIPEIKGIPAQARAYLGIGRGRFLARHGIAEDLQGAFLGGEMKISQMNFIAELDGRSLYAGAGYALPKFRQQGFEIAVSAMVQGRYLQHMRQSRYDLDLSPALGGRVEVVVTPLPGSDIGKKKAEKKKPANKPIIIRQY